MRHVQLDPPGVPVTDACDEDGDEFGGLEAVAYMIWRMDCQA